MRFNRGKETFGDLDILYSTLADIRLWENTETSIERVDEHSRRPHNSKQCAWVHNRQLVASRTRTRIGSGPQNR